MDEISLKQKFNIVNDDAAALAEELYTGALSVNAVDEQSGKSILHIAFENGSFEIVRMFVVDDLRQMRSEGQLVQAYASPTEIVPLDDLAEIMAEYDWSTCDRDGRLASQVARAIPFAPETDAEREHYALWIIALSHQMKLASSLGKRVVDLSAENDTDAFPNLIPTD